MAVTLRKYKATYFPAPKIACTSVKYLLYYIENGNEFQSSVIDGKTKHIHDSVYSTPKFISVDKAAISDHLRFAVVRDPIKRLISAYTNRVVFYKELAAHKLDPDLAKRLGVHPDPTIDEFFSKIAEYRLLSPSIRHHTDAQTVFFGNDLAYFHRIYTVANLPQLVEDLSRLTGMALTLPHEQSGGPKIDASELRPRTLLQAAEYCAGDYALLRDYYRFSN